MIGNWSNKIGFILLITYYLTINNEKVDFYLLTQKVFYYVSLKEQVKKQYLKYNFSFGLNV